SRMSVSFAASVMVSFLHVKNETGALSGGPRRRLSEVFRRAFLGRRRMERVKEHAAPLARYN
ncbi:MAG: hypothetical protein AAGF32_05345, partial [Pseudomonadota bacterium]